MMEAHKKVLDVESHEAVPCEHLGRLMEESGESRIVAVEMKRYEECSVSPTPDSDVMVSTVLMTWSETLISARKTSGMQDWSWHTAHT
jgi:hypothetical protein